MVPGALAGAGHRPARGHGLTPRGSRRGGSPTRPRARLTPRRIRLPPAGPPRDARRGAAAPDPARRAARARSAVPPDAGAARRGRARPPSRRRRRADRGRTAAGRSEERPLCRGRAPVSSASSRASSTRGGKSVASATAAFRKRGWSVYPTGSVSRKVDTATTSMPGSSSRSSTARRSVPSRSPRFAPMPTYAVIRMTRARDRLAMVIPQLPDFQLRWEYAEGRRDSACLRWSCAGSPLQRLRRPQAPQGFCRRRFRADARWLLSPEHPSVLLAVEPGPPPSGSSPGRAARLSLPTRHLEGRGQPSERLVRNSTGSGSSATQSPAAAGSWPATLDEGDPLLDEARSLDRVGAAGIEPPGPGVSVTIIDTGLDTGHPDFAGRPNVALLDPAVAGLVRRRLYHATIVASTVGAAANGVGSVASTPPRRSASSSCGRSPTRTSSPRSTASRQATSST